MTGLFMLPAEVTVTVTREEHHQLALARYPVTPGATRQVVAELAWCTIESGKYRGERAVEVRLGGMRVGELTHAMSERYQDLLTEVTSRGHTPGCEALVHIGKRGVEVSLRLPKAETRVAIPFAQPPAPSPRPVAEQDKPRGKTKPALIAAGIVGFLLFIGLINSPDEKPSSGSANPVADVTTVPTTSSTTDTTTAVTTTTTSTTSSAAPAAPPPAPATPSTRKSTSTKPATTPEEVKPPTEKCDPNYTGCVPVAKDVDCSGGSGDGPAYVDGPVRVVGKDIYRLDNDKDGIACE